MGFPCPFFVLSINLVYVLNFEPECPMRHILISLWIHISLWQIYLLQIPTSSCVIFIVVSPAMLFKPGVSHLSDSFLHIHFLVWIISFSHIIFFLHQFNHSLTGNAFYHIQCIITNAICQWLIPQQLNKTAPPMISQRLHPSAPLLPPCCQPLPSLAAHCSKLATQCWCWPSPLNTWSDIRLWSMHRPLSKQNKIR